MQRLALTDALTGLPNRTGVMQDLVGRLESMKRYTHKKIAIAFIDLDGFKDVNDALGHEMGDSALRQVAARLKTTLRKTDTVGRLGGDEMILILGYEKKEKFSPDKVRAKILDALGGLVFWQGNDPYPVGASIGFATLSGKKLRDTALDEAASALLKQADEDMYNDKQGKPGRLKRAAGEAIKARFGDAPPA